MIKAEQEFLSALQKLVRKARENGGVTTWEEIRENFSGFDLSEEQEQQIREYLEASKIGVDEALPEEELLEEEEHHFLEDYLEELAALKMPDENLLTAIKIQAMAGEKDAQTKLAEAMLPKVVDIARLYAGQGVYLEDLIGTGNEALMQAVSLLMALDSPDEVEGEIGRRVMNAMEDLVSANLDEKAMEEEAEALVNRVAKAAADLSGELRRKVSPGELSAESGLSMDEIMEAVRLTADGIEDLEIVQG